MDLIKYLFKANRAVPHLIFYSKCSCYGFSLYLTKHITLLGCMYDVAWGDKVA